MDAVARSGGMSMKTFYKVFEFKLYLFAALIESRRDALAAIIEGECSNDLLAPEDVLARFPNRVVFIGGGPPVWDIYARFIQHWDITRLPYDGPADRWFDPKWLITGAAKADVHG